MSAQAKSKNQWRRAQQKAKKASASGRADGATDSKEEKQAPTGQTPVDSQSKDKTQSVAEVKPEENSSASTVPKGIRQTVVKQEDSYDFDADPVATEDQAALLGIENPLFDQFKSVFEKFAEPVEAKIDKPEVYYDDDAIPEEDGDGSDNGDRMTDGSDDDGAGSRISRKRKKELNKLSIAQLKATVRRPELVEWTDVSSPDPHVLLAIKSHRNVVPVPVHWSLKREYLSSKRGIEKEPFQLPEFIRETGITEMRDAAMEKQAEQSLKQKQRERIQGKLGKLDIDYQRLYEAFFRFQTKPDLTRFGEIYYEGKEFDTNLKHLRPGELSEELKEALNMPPGAPPPWLINQQRFGPPPSYPALKIAGLNAPPPPGAQWGFHPGGYGKPPVDEFNRPLYGGDIFGVLQGQGEDEEKKTLEDELERARWGEVEEVEEEDEEDEDDDDDDDDDSMDGGDDLDALGSDAGAAAGDDMADIDVARGAEAEITEYGGSEFSLRKQREAAAAAAATTAASGEPADSAGRAAYEVIPERQVKSKGFFGSDRAYDLRGAKR